MKQVISVAANIYLSSNNLKISKAMFNVGMWGEGKDLSPNIKEMIIKKLLVNSTMVQRIRNILSNTRQSTITNAQYTLEFKNNRENRDLYYSLQHINFSITGSKKIDFGLLELRFGIDMILHKSDQYMDCHLEMQQTTWDILCNLPE